MANAKANPTEHHLRRRDDGYYEMLTRNEMVALCSQGMAQEEGHRVARNRQRLVSPSLDLLHRQQADS